MIEKLRFLSWRKCFAWIVITMILMWAVNWTINQRVSWYNQSAEPVGNGSEIVLDNTTFYMQSVICEKNNLAGVTVQTRLIGEQPSAELKIKVYGNDGTVLGEASTIINNGEEYNVYSIILNEPISGGRSERFNIEYSCGVETGSSITISSCNGSGVLCNEETNAYMRLIYKVLDERIYKRLALIICMLTWLLVSGGLYFIFRKKYKAECVFALLYTIFGIWYMIGIPLGGTPDENVHMLRAFDISRGHLIATEIDGRSGGELPENLISRWTAADMRIMDIMEGGDYVLAEEEPFWNYSAAALYSPLTYAPQAIGLFVGNLVSDNIFAIGYFGRFFSWITIGILLFYSIKYIPFGKNLLLAISLLSMNMQMSISLAGDGFAFAIVMAFVSYVLYMRYEKEGVLNLRDKIVLYILLLFIASCKIVYMPICILAFLIPAEKFGGKKEYYKNAIAAAGEVLVVSVGWLVFSSRYLIEYQPGVNSGEQVRYILSHPIAYLNIILNTTVLNGEVYLSTMFGRRLGFYSVVCNAFIVYLYLGILIYVFVKEKNIWNKEKSSVAKRLMLFACACICILIYTSLYVQWTAVGNGEIIGIQGRYFLPILFPFVLAIRKGQNAEGVIDENYEWLKMPYQLLSIYSILTLVAVITYNIV